MSAPNQTPTQHTNDKDICPACQVVDVGREVKAMDDIIACLKPFRNMKQEYFVCLSLDSDQRLIARRIVTIGLLNTTLAHPREVFAGPLTDRAASVIVAHNHPSGRAEPSHDDIDMTQQLITAGELLGVPIEDHVIVTTKESFSFRQHSLTS